VFSDCLSRYEVGDRNRVKFTPTTRKSGVVPKTLIQLLSFTYLRFYSANVGRTASDVRKLTRTVSRTARSSDIIRPLRLAFFCHMSHLIARRPVAVTKRLLLTEICFCFKSYCCISLDFYSACRYMDTLIGVYGNTGITGITGITSEYRKIPCTAYANTYI